MKLITSVALLTGLVAGLPTATEEVRSFELLSAYSQGHAVSARALGDTRMELQIGGACPKVIFIFARGSTEGGNLGSLGPSVGDALEKKYGDSNVWVQGVGGDYKADILDNVLPDGTTSRSIAVMKNHLITANTKCPNAKIVAGGYSQGAALAAAAIRDSSATVREQIKGVVLFGYTKNQQNNGKIINYPADRTKVFCALGDLVCTGTLIVALPHLSYGDEAKNEGPAFLISKIGNI